jgi:hypothetical protein
MDKYQYLIITYNDGISKIAFYLLQVILGHNEMLVELCVNITPT